MGSMTDEQMIEKACGDYMRCLFSKLISNCSDGTDSEEQARAEKLFVRGVCIAGEAKKRASHLIASLGAANEKVGKEIIQKAYEDDMDALLSGFFDAYAVCVVQSLDPAAEEKRLLDGIRVRRRMRARADILWPDDRGGKVQEV